MLQTHQPFINMLDDATKVGMAPLVFFSDLTVGDFSGCAACAWCQK